jgi:hypothetical protein
MGRGRRLGGLWMKAVREVALREEATSSLQDATIRGTSEAGRMAAMRGAGRGALTMGIGTLGLGSMVALEGEVVIMVLVTTLLMNMPHAFQCITSGDWGGILTPGVNRTAESGGSQGAENKEG